MCVLAIVFCSCQKENLNSKIGDESITAFAPSETKTSIDGAHVTWNSGDEIQVWEKARPIVAYMNLQMAQEPVWDLSIL